MWRRGWGNEMHYPKAQHPVHAWRAVSPVAASASRRGVGGADDDACLLHGDESLECCQELLVAAVVLEGPSAANGAHACVAAAVPVIERGWVPPRQRRTSGQPRRSAMAHKEAPAVQRRKCLIMCSVAGKSKQANTLDKLLCGVVRSL